MVIASAIEPAARWFAHYRVPRISSVIRSVPRRYHSGCGDFLPSHSSLISEVAQLPEIVTARLSDISTATTDISFDVSGKSASDIVG